MRRKSIISIKLFFFVLGSTTISTEENRLVSLALTLVDNFVYRRNGAAHRRDAGLRCYRYTAIFTELAQSAAAIAAKSCIDAHVKTLTRVEMVRFDIAYLIRTTYHNS